MSVDLKSLKTISVLYVEDDDLIRNQTRSMFENLFKEVWVAENGKDGLEKFIQNEKDIDVIVSDINMPLMDGLTMASKIRDINKEKPIVLTTAYTDEDFLLKSLEVNIDKYITKPLKIKELATAILNVSQKRKKIAGFETATRVLASANAEIAKEKKDLESMLDATRNELSKSISIIDKFVSTFKIDKKGVILDASTKFLTLYGYSRDELIGENIGILRHDECDGSLLQKLMLDSVYNKKAITSVNIFSSKDQKKIKCENTIIPIFENNGYVSSFIFYQDII